MTAANEPVGVSQTPPIETLFKDSYFVSGSGISSGSGIAKWFKDPALPVSLDLSLFPSCQDKWQKKNNNLITINIDKKS